MCVYIPSQTWNKDEKKDENNKEKNLHDQYLKVFILQFDKFVDLDKHHDLSFCSVQIDNFTILMRVL